MKYACVVVVSLLFLASCSTPEAEKGVARKDDTLKKVSVDTAVTATKPVTTTAAVSYDSVLVLNHFMNEMMNKVNSIIPSPVYDDDETSDDSSGM